jgi:hypothetical protein
VNATTLHETLTALRGLRFEGDFMGMALTFTELSPELTKEQGWGGTFAVPMSDLSLQAIAEARAVQRRRFEEARGVPA